MVSLTASFWGSVLATAILVIGIVSTSSGSMEIEQAALLIPIALFVLVVALFVALPVGVLVGLPLLAAGRNFLPSHILTFTVMFALVGLLGGFIVENLVEDSGHVMLIFGACVGGMHPLVLARANGVRWPKLAASFLLSAAIVPSVAYAGEDAGNLMASEDEFEALCADPYGELASIQVREALDQDTLRNLYIGKWINRGRISLALCLARRVSTGRDARLGRTRLCLCAQRLRWLDHRRSARGAPLPIGETGQ